MPPFAASLNHKARYLAKHHLESLIQLLIHEGYTVIGPVMRDDVIQMDAITSASDLAQGYEDQQSPGRYRLSSEPGQLDYNYVVGPDTAKRWFFPPEQLLFSIHVDGEKFVPNQTLPAAPKLALLGLRPCDLAAIEVQDRVFGYGVDQPSPYRCESDRYYCQTREQSLLIAINCTQPGGTCFCDSWGTGPAATSGYDLAMTELWAGLIIRAGSDSGHALLNHLQTRIPTDSELELEQMKLERAREHMGRKLETDGLPKLLNENIEHPHWLNMAGRCLGCGNCTMVCPTCFCSTVSDNNDLETGSVSRTRQWESCFNHQFTYTTAGPVRSSIRSRYRHMLRHKLATWWEQFGTSGCVGCGRCITWCPVGIDMTDVIKTLQHSVSRQQPTPESEAMV
ncbi:MAG TPA: sulfite reductase subunit A [Phycisphaerales bacterium]|nr:sulfite reductase subunit A [Phycisphaerales bacterium]HCD31215.1 sulfite reductase subunit A [Phycisphaerales bacterium]|tara:strand:+ start:11616 stop:12800 length:1185 start_codon:yes stop_codon:yes gene_type:complete